MSLILQFSCILLEKSAFSDSVLSMGSRSAAFCCQSLTNAIVFMMFKNGISVLNYLDDLASAERKELAEFGFTTLRKFFM